MDRTVELLESIRDSSVDANCDLSTTLRKCKVLAAELGNKPLEEWVLYESDGYPNNVKVPDYRICTLELKGHFAGYGGSSLSNVLIPMSTLPDKTRESYEYFQCRQSIASLETLLSDTEKGLVRVTTRDLAMVLGMSVYKNYNCLEAWAELSTNRLNEILNTVRNRVLDFSLALWKEMPPASRTSKGKKMEDKKITQIFNTTVEHGSANIVGSANHSSIQFNISINDLEALRQVLLDKGISEKDFESLEKSIEQEKTLTADKKFGPKVSAWISQMIEKAANGTWEIGLGAAGALLAEAIGKYYRI